MLFIACMSQSSFSSSDPPDWAIQGTSPQPFRASRSSCTPWVFLLEQGIGATPSNYEKTPSGPGNNEGLPREKSFHWFENVRIDSESTIVDQAGKCLAPNKVPSLLKSNRWNRTEVLEINSFNFHLIVLIK